jgi:CRISPR-associated endonuclease/helicase Cas3
MTLEIADLANPVIKSRVGTRKSLTMVKVPTRKDIQRKVLEIASGLKGSGVPVLVYLNNVDAVSFVQGGLEKEVPKSVQVLTGTKRGLERDKMLGSCPIFARFLANTPQGVTPTPGTVYMVCTSAGEVGVNFSGLHMVMDTVSYERMVQRFGRLDRFGVGGGTVTVIYPENGDASMLPGWDKTVALLEKLPKGPDDTRDVCPSSLDKLPPAECLAAFSPVPAMRTLTRELLDMWSMSTFKQFPGRPPVDPYLHGVEEYDGGRVTVAWRNEVRLFTPEVLAKLNLDGFLDSYPLHPQEKLSDLSRRVFSELKVLAGKYGKAPVWKVSDGAVEVATLSDLVAGKPWDLDGLTIVLPTDIGGLSSNGTLDGSAPQDVALTYDVSDCGGKRGFVQGDLPSGVRQVALFNPNLVGVPGSPMWRWWVSPNEKKVSPGGEMLLQDHLDAARGASLELVSHLDLSPVESRAVVYASALHDVGKDRAVWQVGMGNSSYPQKVVAKSGNHNLPPQHHYRHELGSVVDILARQDFGSEKPEVRDLVLHLVAVHHGRGRPGFPDVEQWVQGSPDDLVRSVILDIARRFDRLTEQYGRCQLAYLESLLRAVDVHTS